MPLGLSLKANARLVVAIHTALLVPAVTAQDQPATVADAASFVSMVESEYEVFGEYSARVSWIQANFITYDSNWLMTKVSAEGTELGVRFANGAKRFDGLELLPDLTRKMKLIKLSVNLPAPETPGAAQELAEINTRMRSHYATGAIDLDGQRVVRNDLEEMMGIVRDAGRLQDIWTKWREVPVAIRADYARMVDIANAGAEELGFRDVGYMWRSRYDLEPDAFAAETDRLWSQVKPLYDQLHCYVRAGLNAFYGDDFVPLDQPIRADLLGNMWAQQWGNIYDLVAPAQADVGYDLTALLESHEYDAGTMIEAGEAFFTSLGFEPLPETFWKRSLITRPQDREVVCHASAWNLDGKDDVRIKMCTKVNADDFQTVHHELGHNFYQRAYKHQSTLYRGGANAGFHEAVGDMIALSITPEYLQRIGLLDEIPDASKDIGLLLDQALDKIAFMPFGLLVDKWRWQVFSGVLTPEQYNEGWWALRLQYQGVRPPVTRRPDHFDPGGKYHIPNNVEYTRYFLAHVLEFQFHKAACEMTGWEGPLHRCSIYGSTAVGEQFNAMLESGQSRPWPEALEAFTGTREMDGSAVVDYFAPLLEWLREQNRGRSCGW